MVYLIILKKLFLKERLIIDILILIIILSSCIVATFRGFIKETFSIISWIFSLFVAFNLFEKFKLELVDYISQKIVRTCDTLLGEFHLFV